MFPGCRARAACFFAVMIAGAGPARAAQDESEGAGVEEDEAAEGEEETAGEEAGEKLAEPPAFDYTEAVLEAADVLHGGEVERMVKQCLMKFSYNLPPELSLIVKISPVGEVASIDTREKIEPPSKLCIEGEFSTLSFVPSPDGYAVTARYGFEKETAAEAGEEEEKEEGEEREKAVPGDPDNSRVIYFQTAHTRKKGVLNFTAFWGGNYRFALGLHENIDITFNTMAPVMIWGMGVFPKFAFQVHEKVRLGFKVDFLVLYPYYTAIGIVYEEVNHNLWLMYGGAPLILTLGDETSYFNFALHLEGITTARWDSDGSRAGALLVISPSAGACVSVSDKAKFNLEVWTFFIPTKDMESIFNGRVWGIFYGFRIFGRKRYGDIGFFLPVYEGWWHTFQRFIPMGFLLLSFGVRRDAVTAAGGGKK